MSDLSYQTLEIEKIFPELPQKAIVDLDDELKGYISSHNGLGKRKELISIIDQKVRLYITGNKNDNTFRNNCEYIIKLYQRNDMIIRLQEGWFCLFAYIITSVLMITNIFDLSSECSDLFSACTFFLILVIWVLIQKCKCFMTSEAMLILDCFNRVAPSMTIITGLFFYFVSFAMDSKILLIVIVGISLLVTFLSTYHLYRKCT
ncbi:MAG: hypothetical protein K6G24_01320 [Lachnospiraceae bacterium]|nr:hypothetical protein [Lachnospiraceae bacterium]